MTFWYTTDRYGSATEPEFQELKRQLEASGLFESRCGASPGRSSRKASTRASTRSWPRLVPDFPDPDDFVAPFVGRRPSPAARTSTRSPSS
ncbi:solute-binding transport lipoprotein [Streptomyces badius]